MNKEPRTMQVADAATASRAPENTPAMVKKIGKTTYKVHVHFSNTSTETMSDKIKRINVTENRKQILFPVSHLERVQSLHRNIFTREREL